MRKLRHPATIATTFLERPPLGSLVVRLIAGDPIGISGVKYLCVAIRSLLLSCRPTWRNLEINQLSFATYLRLAFCLLLCGSVESQGNCVTFRVIVKFGIIVDVRYCPACNSPSPFTDRFYTSFLEFLTL